MVYCAEEGDLLTRFAAGEPEGGGAGDNEGHEGRHTAYAGVFVSDEEDASAEGGHDGAEDAEPAQ